MQPASSKHGPVSDEVLAKEARETIQSSQGNRIEEDPTVDRPAVTLRSDIAAALRRTLFPAGREELLEHLDSVHASDEVRDLVATLPEKRKFRNVEHVWEQLGGQNPDAKRF